MSLQDIAVVAFDGISPFHLSVPCQVFGPEQPDPRDPRFRVRVCAEERGPLRTTAGFTIEATHSLRALASADTIIVPSWRNPQQPAPAALQAALQRAHRRGARIVGLCLGAFVLADAGLLDGRRATTHWQLGPLFAQRFPQVHLQPDVLYVDDGGVLTSAGTAAGIDCCLHLMRVEHGAEVAMRAARRMVVAPHREGGQAQYIEQPLATRAADQRLSGLLQWALQRLDQAHTLDSLADRAAMSRRSFTRHFREATGVTVGRWLLAQRLALAQRLLETSGHSIESVAGAAGLGSAMSLRQHFGVAFGLSPSAYRKTFRGRGSAAL